METNQKNKKSQSQEIKPKQTQKKAPSKKPQQRKVKHDPEIYSKFVDLAFTKYTGDQTKGGNKLTQKAKDELARLSKIVLTYSGHKPNRFATIFAKDRYIRVVEGFPVPDDDYQAIPGPIRKGLF